MFDKLNSKFEKSTSQHDKQRKSTDAQQLLDSKEKPCLNIGARLLSNPFVLAPLAGYTDLAFRLLCREMGASICVSEMVSSFGLVYQQKNTQILLKSTPADHPLSIQLFGNNPEIMSEAGKLINDTQAEVIDLNMGCPVRKVIKKGAGAALMKDIRLAENIIRQVVNHSNLPVTVKFRSGWNNDNISAPEFAQMVEAAGASALTIHARTWAQGFSGMADWQHIAQVKNAVNIPVIGNGDIHTYADGERMLSETGCDGIMVGRGALGNPWVFSKQGRPDALHKRLPVMLRHLELVNKHLQADKMLFRIKNHLGRYLSGLPGASRIRQKIMACENTEALFTLLQNTHNQLTGVLTKNNSHLR